MKQSAVDTAIGIAARVVRRHVPDKSYKLFLFGSRASGKARERSDIDIGIEGPEILAHETIAEIADELGEAPTLYSVDFVDFKRLPAKFRAVAKERAPIDV